MVAVSRPAPTGLRQLLHEAAHWQHLSRPVSSWPVSEHTPGRRRHLQCLWFTETFFLRIQGQLLLEAPYPLPAAQTPKDLGLCHSFSHCTCCNGSHAATIAQPLMAELADNSIVPECKAMLQQHRCSVCDVVVRFAVAFVLQSRAAAAPRQRAHVDARQGRISCARSACRRHSRGSRLTHQRWCVDCHTPLLHCHKVVKHLVTDTVPEDLCHTCRLGPGESVFTARASATLGLKHVLPHLLLFTALMASSTGAQTLPVPQCARSSALLSRRVPSSAAWPVCVFSLTATQLCL